MSERAASSKSADAYRTISEVAEDLGLPQHVLRFWETRFPQVKPLKRAGGRRFYRPADVELLRAVKALLYDDGYTIKGVQRMLRDQGPKAIATLTATPSSAARAATDDAAASFGEAPGETSADRSVGPPTPGWHAASSERLAPEAARGTVIVDPSPDPTLRQREDAPTDIIGRLHAVLSDLDACERLIRQVKNSSPIA